MSDDQPLLVEDRDRVRWLWFNRPRVRNAQNTAMLEALERALDDTRRTASIDALVLAGKGAAFSAGHDLKEIVANPDYAAAIATAEGRWRWEDRLFVRPIQMLRELAIPTICRVQGHCVAAGLMFAASTDFVVASNDATFSSPIIPRMAINDAEVPAFAWLLGERRAKQLLWLGETLGAEEARAVGLVNWVVAPDELDAKIDQITGRLLAIPSETLAMSKATFRFMADRRGYRDTVDFHFMAHSLSHQTSGAKAAVEQREKDISKGGSAT